MMMMIKVQFQCVLDKNKRVDFGSAPAHFACGLMVCDIILSRIMIGQIGKLITI